MHFAARLIEETALPITEIAYCPHPAFPVGCFCRKPLPGMGVYLSRKYKLDPAHLVMVGDMDSDANFAASIGAQYFDAKDFFSDNSLHHLGFRVACSPKGFQ